MTHISDMHKILNLDTLYQRRCQHVCNNVHKLLNGLGPVECIDQIKYVHEIHNIPTRHAGNLLLHVPRTRLKCCERDFLVMAPKIWNQVPLAIRQIVSPPEFKEKIKSVTFV